MNSMPPYGTILKQRSATLSSLCTFRNHNMVCDIFIRSYYKDLEWLGYCLTSIDRFCSGFRSVIVVVPQASWLRLRGLGQVASNVRFDVCDNYRDDYLGQQVTKLHADLYTDADLICHVDSDCIFVCPFGPADLLDEGRCHILMRPIESLGYLRPWLRPTETFLGWKILYDFMQHPPFTFPRRIYAEIRDHALGVHCMDLSRYITSQPPRGFSEFNVLGAYAYERHRDWFTWVDVTTDISREYIAYCQWHWSWGGLTPKIRQEIEILLAK